MNKSFKSFFFLKKKGGYISGQISIYLRITIDGKKSELTVQRKCDPL
jgi:CRISPR/Cas system-associated protein endoribonuclease Cas2